MALTKAETHTPDLFDRLFHSWMLRPWASWSSEFDSLIRVEEYQENGTLVVKAEMPGLDPDKDVSISVEDGVLHIAAERREEKSSEDKHFHRQELRYGSFSRDLPLPTGVSEADIKASYKDGMLEIRVPSPVPKTTPPVKIPVSKN